MVSQEFVNRHYGPVIVNRGRRSGKTAIAEFFRRAFAQVWADGYEAAKRDQQFGIYFVEGEPQQDRTLNPYGEA